MKIPNPDSDRPEHLRGQLFELPSAQAWKALPAGGSMASPPP